MTPGDHLPPLILSCRPVWRRLVVLAALVLPGLGAGVLAADPGPGPPGPASAAAAVVLFLLGAGCIHFLLRYVLARLVLDDRGFRLEGPLRRGVAVDWIGVTSWTSVGTGPGPRTLRILHAGRRRLSVPLIYEDAHLLEVGLAQRQFPRI